MDFQLFTIGIIYKEFLLSTGQKFELIIASNRGLMSKTQMLTEAEEEFIRRVAQNFWRAPF